MLENIEDLKKKEKWLRTIYEVTRDVNSSLSLSECLRLITEKVTKLLNVEIMSLMLLDKKRNELRIEHAIGLPEEIIKAARVRVEKDICVSAWVAKEGKPLLINDIKKDGRFPLRNLARYHTDSLLSVPLKVKGRVIGVLNVNNKVDGGLFTPDDLDLLSAFADEAAIAVENSRVFEELMQVNKKFMEINHLKSQFLADLSHRLRTPLVTTKYFTSVLRDELDTALSSHQKEYLVTVEDNISRLNHLVDNLLDVAKIESGKVVLNREFVNIVSLIKREIALMDISAREKNITIKTFFIPRLPNIFIDQERINEVFNILIDNALKFTEPGGKIIIQVKKRDELVEVSIRDTGIGIAAKDLDKLFIEFSRLESAVEKGIKGTGLGLAIARQIIEMHKGTIFANSKFGKGSVFVFTLPLYTPFKFLVEQIAEKIEKAEENGYPFCLIILAIQKFNRIKKRLEGKESLRLLKDAEKIIKDTMRRPEDEVLIAKDNYIIVFCKADKKGGTILSERLKKILLQHKFPIKKGTINLDFDLNVLNYPEDSKDEEVLIKKVRSFINESKDEKKE